MTQHAPITESTAVEGVPQCKHYWVIQPAMGPVSQGICQNCSEVQEFKNYVEGASWGDARLANRSSEKATQDVSRVVGDQTDSEREE